MAGQILLLTPIRGSEISTRILGRFEALVERNHVTMRGCSRDLALRMGTPDAPSAHSWENCYVMQELCLHVARDHQGGNAGGHPCQFGSGGSHGGSSGGFPQSGSNEQVGSSNVNGQHSHQNNQ